MIMRALSIHQPWAWFIVTGFKPIENRDRRLSHRGPLLIHASKAWDEEEVKDDLEFAIATAKASCPQFTLWPTLEDLRITRGHIVGQVEMVDCVDSYDSPWFFGRYGYVLSNAAPCTPVPVRGSQGLMKVEWPPQGIAL